MIEGIGIHEGFRYFGEMNFIYPYFSVYNLGYGMAKLKITQGDLGIHVC